MTYIDAIIAFFAAAGIKVGTIFGAIAGGFLSLNFFDGLTPAKRWVTAISGVLLGIIFSPLFIQLLSLPTLHSIELGVAGFIGLFGMSIVSAAFKGVRELDVKGIIESWVKK